MEERGFSDLLSTASSLLKTQAHHSSSSSSSSSSSASGHSGHKPSSHAQKPSYGKVLASAQVVMGAAKAKLQKAEGEEVDMGKLAGAAGTLVGAASHYGKLHQTSYGKYAQKAEAYLHTYEAKHHKVSVSSSPAQPVNQGQGQGHHSPSAPAARYPPQGYPSAQYTSQTQPQTQTQYPPSFTASSETHQSHGYVEGYPPPGYPSGQYPAPHSQPRPASAYPTTPQTHQSYGYVEARPPPGYPTR